MARLPLPGGDNGNWGTILNDYLSQSLKSDGTLQDNAVTSSALAPNSVTNSALASNAVNAAIIADGSITEALLDTALQAKVNAAGTTGVTSVAGKTGVVTLIKSDVGLDQVDNTSDAAKNSATATLTSKTINLANNTLTGTTAQFNTALSDNDFATLAGSETLTNKTIDGGSNTLTGIPQSAVTNLSADLAGKAATSHTHAIANVTNLQSELNTRARIDADGVLQSVTTNPDTRSSTFTFNPNLYNDLFYNTQKGGSVAATKNGSPITINETIFTPGVALTNLDSAAVASDVFEIVVDCWKTFPLAGTNRYGMTFSANSASAKDVKIEVFADAVWTEIYNNVGVEKTVHQATSTAAVSRLRFTLKNATGLLRLVSIFGFAVNGELLGEGFIPRGGATIYGPISYTTNPTNSSHLARKGYVDSVATGMVKLTDVQTLTNKTLTDPKINSIKDTNGNTILDYNTVPSAVNRFYISNQSAGNSPTLGVEGTDSNIDLKLTPKGMGKVKVNNAAVLTSKMRYPMYSDPSLFEPWPQMLCYGGNWTLGSGDIPLTFFIPDVDMTVSNIITMGWNDTSQTNATVCKVAIYRVDDVFSGGNKMECIARSGHKADRWNGSVLDTAPIVDNGAASPSPISSVNLVAGQQYAVGFISIGHTGSPKLSALGTFRKNTLLPNLGYFGGGGHTDVPVYITTGWIEEWTYIWFALT